MAWATVVLPLPDSPTRPRTSPRPMAKETSDTACTAPRADPNSTFRPATSSRVWSGCMTLLRPATAGKPDDEAGPLPDGAEPGVGDLIDREVQHGDRGAGQSEQRARRDELPPGALQQAGIALRPVQDRAPAHRRQVAEAEELQGRQGADAVPDRAEQHAGDQRVQVRQHLGHDDPQRALTDDGRRRDVIAPDDRECLGPD